MESIYYPLLRNYKYDGTRKSSPHTVLHEIRNNWPGVKWAITGDTQRGYEEIKHCTLMILIRKRIQDERFLNLIWKMLRAGIDVNGKQNLSVSGTFSGGMLSSLFYNIYINELDVFISNLSQDFSSPKNTSAKAKAIFECKNKLNMTSVENSSLFRRKMIRKKSNSAKVKFISKTMSNDQSTTFVYIRYESEWLIGILGTTKSAQVIFKLVKHFVKTKLCLTVLQEKVHTPLLPAQYITFLGYNLKMSQTFEHHTQNLNINQQPIDRQQKIFAPINVLISTLASHNFCTNAGRGIKKKGWIFYPDKIIINRYNYILRGYRTYYSPTDNYVSALSRIEYILRYSCAHTLAAKHRTRISKQLKRLSSLGLEITTSFTNTI